jgi:hypothetical protein
MSCPVRPGFKEWCLENKVVFNGIDAAFFEEGGRGVKATKCLEPGKLHGHQLHMLWFTLHTLLHLYVLSH